MFAEIRLDLDNSTDALAAARPADEPFAKQFLGDQDGVAVIKMARESLHGRRLVQFPV